MNGGIRSCSGSDAEASGVCQSGVGRGAEDVMDGGCEGRVPGLHVSRTDGIVESRDRYTEELNKG